VVRNRHAQLLQAAGQVAQRVQAGRGPHEHALERRQRYRPFAEAGQRRRRRARVGEQPVDAGRRHDPPAVLAGERFHRGARPADGRADEDRRMPARAVLVELGPQGPARWSWAKGGSQRCRSEAGIAPPCSWLLA
jgi:hypothetical protein